VLPPYSPVDIDIALDDLLGREFADFLNQYLPTTGEQAVSIGMVLQDPEKSKHTETANAPSQSVLARSGQLEGRTVRTEQSHSRCHA
jgi:hypothetical protein